MQTSRRVAFGLAIMALVTAACSGDDAAETTLGAAASTTATPAPSTTTTTAPPPPTTTTSTPPQTTTTTTTEAPAPSGPPPGSMLITNEDGVHVVTLDGVVSQVIAADPGAVGGIIDFAIDDTRGGVVFHPNQSPWIHRGPDSIVYWVPQGAGSHQELLVPAADQGLGLEDVATRGDAAMVYYTRVEGTESPETARQTLRRFDLDTKTVTEVSVVGGWESGSSPISVGGETIVENSGAEGFLWIDFTDLNGVEFDSPANPISDEEFDCFPDCFYYADLSPDGEKVAVGRLAPNAGGFPTTPEIEIRDVATGTLELSVALPEQSGFPWIHSLDLSATHVLINLMEEGAVFPYAIVVDIGSGGVSTYSAPIAGVARFLRSLPGLDGVVSWP